MHFRNLHSVDQNIYQINVIPALFTSHNLIHQEILSRSVVRIKWHYTIQDTAFAFFYVSHYHSSVSIKMWPNYTYLCLINQTSIILWNSDHSYIFYTYYYRLRFLIDVEFWKLLMLEEFPLSAEFNAHLHNHQKYLSAPTHHKEKIMTMKLRPQKLAQFFTCYKIVPSNEFT